LIETIIDATGVWKRYDTGRHKVDALKGIDLMVKRGEVVAIMGPSGCGKTTLLNCLSGLDVIDSGTIKIAGHDLKDLTDNQRTDFRAREMGFVFQTYNLLPVLTGIENVELPMLVGGVRPSKARKRAQEAIEMVGVGEWARHRPAEMSGGQRQRFTIARALATNPAIVWADEPTGALDTETSAGIMDLMVQLNHQNHQTFVWVTHSEEVGALAQRLIRMRDGLIVSDLTEAPAAQDGAISSAEPVLASSFD
jgi:putative ABC transport system ATP-binding protein